MARTSTCKHCGGTVAKNADKCPHCGETTDGELAGWLREAKNDGKRFLSVKWQPKDDKPQANGDRAQQGPQEQPGGGDLDDEIPFSPVKLLP